MTRARVRSKKRPRRSIRHDAEKSAKKMLRLHEFADVNAVLPTQEDCVKEPLYVNLSRIMTALCPGSL